MRVFVITMIMCLGVARAEPVMFVHVGSGSGTLDGKRFDESVFIIRAFGDTNDRESFLRGFFVTHTRAEITIEGLGRLEFVTSTQTFVNNRQELVGLSRTGGGLDLYNGPRNAEFESWDMTVGVGPHAGQGDLLQWHVEDVLTNRGVLMFDQGRTSATFSAVVPASGPLALAVVAALGTIGFRRRGAWPS